MRAAARTDIIDASWNTISPVIDHAIMEKMQHLGLPSQETHVLTRNHFHAIALDVVKGKFKEYMRHYAEIKTSTRVKRPRLERILQDHTSHMVEDFRQRREQIKAYGWLDTAHTDDNQLGSWIISHFTNNGSPPAEEKDPIHLEIASKRGLKTQDLTKHDLEQEFMKTIEYAGFRVMMLYLKQEYGVEVEVGNKVGTPIPHKPADPEIQKPQPKKG